MVQEFIKDAYPVDEFPKITKHIGAAPEHVAKHLTEVFAECAFIHGELLVRIREKGSVSL